MTMKASCDGEKLFDLADRFTTPKSLADTIVFNNRIAAEKPLSLAAVAAKVSTEGRPQTRVDVRRTELRLRDAFAAFMRKAGHSVEFIDDDDGRNADKTIGAAKAEKEEDSSTVVEKPSPAPKPPEPAQVAEVAHAIATVEPAEHKQRRWTGEKYSWNDKELTLKEWAAELGIPITTLSKRRTQGWPVEKMLGTPYTGRGGDHKSKAYRSGEAAPRQETPKAKPAPSATGRTVDELRAKIHRLDEIEAQIAALQKAREELTAELETAELEGRAA